MNRRAASLVSMTLAVIVTLCGRTAGADVAPLPPTDCPAGTYASSCHGGAYCGPTPCVDSSSCKGGTTCQEVRWCIAQSTCGGRWPFDAAPPLHDTYEGSCAGSATCSKGTCRTLKVCTTEESVSDRGCSCATASASADVAAWMLSVVALLLWRRSRLR